VIRPEPVTIGGKSGVIVFLDANRQPVASDDPTAVLAKAVFDDGSRAFYDVAPTPKAKPQTKDGP
jgi:hypothetical protein